MNVAGERKCVRCVTDGSMHDAENRPLTNHKIKEGRHMHRGVELFWTQEFYRTDL